MDLNLVLSFFPSTISLSICQIASSSGVFWFCQLFCCVFIPKGYLFPLMVAHESKYRQDSSFLNLIFRMVAFAILSFAEMGAKMATPTFDNPF